MALKKAAPKNKSTNTRNRKDSHKLERGWLGIGRSSHRSKALPTLARQRLSIFTIYSTIIGGGLAVAFVMFSGVLFTSRCYDDAATGQSNGQCASYGADIISAYTGVIENPGNVASVNVVSAVKKFQKANSLPETGKFDTATWGVACKYGLSMSPNNDAYKAAIKAGCDKTNNSGGTASNGSGTSNPKPGSGSSTGGSTSPSTGNSGTPPTTPGSGTPSGVNPGGTGSQPSTGGTINNSLKPSDASTGPRGAISTTRAGGSIAGTFNQTRFNGNVEIAAGAAATTLTDCVIDGSLSIRSTNLVIIDHCDINGWFGHRTNNKDKNKQLLIVRNSKITGETNNDAVRLANSVGWADNSTYQNTLIEDSIIHSPFVQTPGAHFDAIQFGGGNNHVFNRVLISYTPGPMVSGAVAYVNNDTKNGGVVFNDLWIEGGGVSYVLRGAMTVNRCLISASAAGYGYVGGSGSTLNNCYDTNGKKISGKLN